METVENCHSTSTPQSSSPPSPKSHSKTPLPVPPRPSFLQNMATSFGSDLPLVVVGQINLNLLFLNLLPCLGGTGHPPPIHIVPVLLIHHLHQENPGTLSQPTEANVYVMIASVGVVACGKYTTVLYWCYFGSIYFPLIFGVTFLTSARNHIFL